MKEYDNLTQRIGLVGGSSNSLFLERSKVTGMSGKGTDFEEILAGYEPGSRRERDGDPSLYILEELDEDRRSRQRSSPTTVTSRSMVDEEEEPRPRPPRGVSIRGDLPNFSFVF